MDGQEKKCSRMPEVRRPMTAPPAATPTHVPTAFPRSSGGKMVVITESVTGMIKAARDAHHRANRDQGARRVDEERDERDGSEEREPDRQQRLPPVAVADRARRQEQGGEHDRVGVDDPLQLRLRRAGVTRDFGEGDVEACDRRDDHHQREAHDPKHGPAVLRFGLEGHGRSHSLPPTVAA